LRVLFLEGGGVVEKQALVVVSGLVVLGLWSTALLSGLVTQDYTGAQIATPVMLIFAGWIFWRADNDKK
jgi:hypothetical protein